MIPKIDGALLKLSTIMLSALVSVACNSDPEPLDEGVLSEDMTLSESGAVEGCELSVPEAVVDVSKLDVTTGLVDEIGGLCKISNMVIESAGNLLRLNDETAMDWEVKDFLEIADLEVYSVGIAKHEDTFCPAIVWSFYDAQLGQLYNVAGLDKCSAIATPHTQLFNPEKNPNAQLTGDYIRQELEYNGSLPAQFDYKGGSFPFLSEEEGIDEEAQLALMQADRSILGDAAKRYDYWTTGDEIVDNGYLSAAEVLSRRYHSEDVKRMMPGERALAALHSSYGAPTVGEVKQIDDGIQPGVHATIVTSSGEQFVIVVKPSPDMSNAELLEWLPGSRPELLVVQRMDRDDNEKLTLEGALFTDGLKTVAGKLFDCRCVTQGMLGWLGRDHKWTNNEIEQSRKDFIARARNTEELKEWTFSSELSPRAISYTLSSYSTPSRNNDALFVVHGGGAEHTLYVAVDLTCKNESLLFDFGRKSLSLPALCKKVGPGGVAYTLLDESSELTTSMRGGSTMTIGLLKPEAESPHEQFRFSLMGATQAMNALDADEVGIEESVMKHFKNRDLQADAEKVLFEQLAIRPVFCRPGANSSGCFLEEPAPIVAAAKPVARTARRARPVVVAPGDYTLGYARIIAAQLGEGNQPECLEVVKKILVVADYSGTPEARTQQIDQIVGGAPNICF